jgi:hypothetical protein
MNPYEDMTTPDALRYLAKRYLKKKECIDLVLRAADELDQKSQHRVYARPIEWRLGGYTPKPSGVTGPLVPPSSLKSSISK